MAGETMLSALAEESSPPSSCLQSRSLSDPPFEAITLSPGQAHQRISSHLHAPPPPNWNWTRTQAVKIAGRYHF